MHSLVAQLRLHVGEDGCDQISLLSFSDLSLVSDPRVEDGLDVGGDGGLLSESISLVLESSGFLIIPCDEPPVSCAARYARLTLESSKRDLVRASTSLSSPTDSIRDWTASVWAAREVLRISVTFYDGRDGGGEYGAAGRARKGDCGRSLP